MHHIIVFSLYLGPIFANVIGIGVFLTWLHDIGDIFANICGLCHRVDLHYLTILSLFIHMGVWFYTRLLILPCYIFTIFKEVRFPEHVYHFQPIIWIECVALLSMQLLHILWFGMFLRMGYNAIVKGERKDAICDGGRPDPKKVQ